MTGCGAGGSGSSSDTSGGQTTSSSQDGDPITVNDAPVDNGNDDPVAEETRPVGIYSLDAIVDRPFVDGVAVRVRWKDMEPTEGSYDFTRIRDMIDAAEALGQSITIANIIADAPDWLIARSETFTNLGESKIVPWDPVMLAALETFVEAQANYEVNGIPLKDHPAVKQVSASIGGINSLRVTDLPAGYTPAKLQTAVHQSVNIWADRYPTGKHLYIGVFNIADGETSPTTIELIRDSLLAEFDGVTKPRLNLFQELLTGQKPVINGNLGKNVYAVRDDTSIMFQACGAWTEQDGAWAQCDWVEPLDLPDTGFVHATNNFNATYYEIYIADLQNDDYYNQFEYWAAEIRTLANSLD